MADDPIIPAPRDPDAPAPVAARRKGVTCEFCECALSADGDVLKRGQRARAMMELDDRLAAVTKERDALLARVAALEVEVATLTTPAHAAGSGGVLSML